MVSSKLSRRRATAKKPSLCISLPPPVPPYELHLYAHVEFGYPGGVPDPPWVVEDLDLILIQPEPAYYRYQSPTGTNARITLFDCQPPTIDTGLFARVEAYHPDAGTFWLTSTLYTGGISPLDILIYNWDDQSGPYHTAIAHIFA